MPRDDEPADARHERTSSVPMLFMLLGAALVAVVLVGGVGLFFARKARDAERLAMMDAKLARVKAAVSEPGTAEVEKILYDGRQLDPIPVTLSTVSVEKAGQLAGRLLLITLALLDNDDRRGGFIVYSNDGPDGDEGSSVERSVWVPKGRRVAMTGLALGTLTVGRAPRPAAGGGRPPGTRRRPRGPRGG